MKTGTGRVVRAAVGAATVALLAAVAVRPAGAQGTQVLDRGTFDLREGDASVGTETFAIRRERSSVRAVGRIQVGPGAAAWHPGQVWLQTSPDFRPELFRVEPGNGSGQMAAAVRQDGRLRVQTTSGEGQRSKEFVAPAEVSVFHPDVAHHLYFLLRQHACALEEEGEARVPAVLPTERRRVTLRIRRGGTGAITLGGRDREAVSYVIETDGWRVEAWADEEGRILRVHHPGEGRTAERAGDESP